MKLLVVIDTVNFHGGAHIATWAMIDALIVCGWMVDILTGSDPTDVMRKRLAKSKIFVIEDPFPRKGVRFLIQGVCRRLKIGWVPNWTIDPSGEWRHKAVGYDTVLVIGENSHYRNLIGGVKGPKKVIFIHTDYVRWRDSVSWARVESRCDRWTYRNYDVIGVVGYPNAERFSKVFPQFKSKVKPFHNLMKVLWSRPPAYPNNGVFKIVSLGRLNWGAPKCTELSIKVASKLKTMGLRFEWTVLGDGVRSEVERLKTLVKNLDLSDCFLMPGYAENPHKELVSADVMALLSSYEGMSNAIYESLCCGTPVIATNVGGASEQVQDGVTGRVVDVDVDKIAEVIAEVICKREIVEAWRKNLKSYFYDNEKVVEEYLQILGEKKLR